VARANRARPTGALAHHPPADRFSGPTARQTSAVAKKISSCNRFVFPARLWPRPADQHRTETAYGEFSLVIFGPAHRDFLATKKPQSFAHAHVNNMSKTTP
jgi:hypothetical protein